MDADATRVGAIILAGGRGSRLGGVAKAELVVGGRRLLDVVLDAVSVCAPRVVVGPRDAVVPDGVVVTREEPAFAGPAAAVAAGCASVVVTEEPTPEWVLLLACDLPGAAAAVGPLVEAARNADEATDAIAAVAVADPDVDPDDLEDGRIEWLVSIVRTSSLGVAIARRGPDGLLDASMGRLLGELRWRRVAVPIEATDDVDTWDDHARWLRRIGSRGIGGR